MKKLILSILLPLVSAAPLLAVPFDTGATGGVVKVGPTVSVGDGYTSLAAAVTAYNGLVGGINANWTVEIVENLTEPAHIYMANLTNGFTVTIKPEATKTPTITFTQTTGGTTAGAFVIGTNTGGAVADTNLFASTNGYVIDGSNNGTTSRDLTITNAANIGTTIIVRIVGETNGVVLKNLNVISTKSGGTDTVIGLGAGKLVTNYIPDGLVVDNCVLRADLLTNTSNTSGIGVAATNAFLGAIDANLNMRDHVFRNNTIYVRHRGIAPVYCRNYTVENNTIYLNNPNVGAESTAIGDLLSNADTVAPGTVTIRNNKVLQVQTANATAGFGITGITVGIGSGTTYNISNNVVTGMSAAATTTDTIFRGLRLASAADIYNVEHNSFNVGTSSGALGTTVGRVGGISIQALTTGTASIKNNIVRYANSTGSVIVGQGATGLGTGAFVGNNLFSVSAPTAVITGDASSPYATSSAWLTAGFDAAGGQSVDPAATTPAWNSDLKFPGISGAPTGLGVVGSSAIAADIDGEVRPATGAVPGADQPVNIASLPNWDLY